MLDCIPLLQPICEDGFFIDSENQCIAKDSCSKDTFCNGEGATAGSYNEELNRCVCNNVESDTAAYCDETCEFESLKAYYTKEGKILLTAGNNERTYDVDDFGDSLFLNIQCDVDLCPITSIKQDSGSVQSSSETLQVFIDKWMEKYPNYKSPYAETRRRILMKQDIDAAMGGFANNSTTLYDTQARYL